MEENSYVVLARKYRPASFQEVRGQEHVTRSLSNAITRGKVGQAYLLSGPRGVGKTSIARIFAKSLNCAQGPTPQPCLACSNCKEITQGTSMAVWEVDGASHNSVDNVRELIDSFRASPPPGYKYKLYIIDEVHMLSVAAFNALLKSLEEPPPFTVFILATTEVHKIPETVVSRCQRFDLRALKSEHIEEQLRALSVKESIQIEEEALRLIARVADGSMRDAETLLERVHSFCDGAISAAEASQVLGVTSRNVLLSLSQSILAHDAEKVLVLVNDVFVNGADEGFFIKELVLHWRELFLTKISKDAELLALGLREDEIVQYRRLVASLATEDVQDLYRILRDGCDTALRGAYVRYSIEALLVRMALRKPMIEFSELVTLLKNPIRSPIEQKSENKPVIKTIATEQSVAASSFDWDDLIGFVSSKGSKLLAEQLKRLTAVGFVNGAVTLKGADFSISSIKRDAEKVEELLREFSESRGNRIEGWRIAYQVEAASSASAGTATKEIGGHPAIQSVQRFFPGSMVEGIKERP